jgi:penicillin-binding protein 2
MLPSARLREVRAGRFGVLAGIVFAGFALIVVGLLRLQVVQHGEYLELAKENRVRLEVLRAPRGAIYDRHGELLADSAPSFSIQFRPFPSESVHLARAVLAEDYVARVSSLVEEDTSEVRLRIAEANRTGKSATLRRNASFKVLAAVEETRSELPGIEVQVEPLRRYPLGPIAAHLLGYAGEINEIELDSLSAAGYRSGDLIGRSGVERSYEDALRGRDGAEFVVVNAMGKRVSTLEEEPPRPPEGGHDLILTIDLHVQRAMEEAMAKVERGAGVAIDPRDGSVLAMVSRPSFDPNEFSRGISFDRWRQLSTGGANPLLDRALQGAYPPGSTFKVVSMIAALRHGIATPQTRLSPCNGSWMFGGRRFGCWKPEGHGSLDLIEALQHSCDVYFYQLGPKIGLPRLEATARELGLGERTGVDLPQERKGLIPSPAWYDSRWGAGRWRQGLMLNLIIGQGEILVTPLQLALMTAEAANGGRAIRPHVVREVRGAGSPHGGRPRQSGVTADPAVWTAVQTAMERVIDSGTGTAAKVPGVRVAGKTGTAQNPHGKDHALFVCYAPADHPEIAMAIVVENSGHGGSIAAPIAGRILRELYVPDSLSALRIRANARADSIARWKAQQADTTGGALGD